MKELIAIQSELKAPKGQTNKFGGYNYRSCEDILEAVKPLLSKHGAALTLSDEIVLIGNNTFVKATATFYSSAPTPLSVSAFARHPVDKKGMDDSQITGATSSYARKYALNGLFCIDDTKDADATNDHGKGGNPNPGNAGAGSEPAGKGSRPNPKPAPPAAPTPAPQPAQSETEVLLSFMADRGVSREDLEDLFKVKVEKFTAEDKKKIKDAIAKMRIDKTDFFTAFNSL